MKQHFMQSPELKNFDVLDKFRDICEANPSHVRQTLIY